MIFELHTEENKRVTFYEEPTVSRITRLLEQPVKCHYCSMPSTMRVNITGSYEEQIQDNEQLISPLFLAIHESFCEHISLSLSPQIIWQSICQEIATHVKQHPGMYNDFFNNGRNEKRMLTVRDDSLVYDSMDNDWGRTISLFEQQFTEVLGKSITELFLPQFSTMSQEDRVAILLSFMDAASPFYEYTVVTRCGIPRIRLEGSSDDWLLLRNQAIKISEGFPSLVDYFRDLISVLNIIADMALSGISNNKFWDSIYKIEATSGGPFISGWITSLIAHLNSTSGAVLRKNFGWKGDHNIKLNEFPSHVATVGVMWNYLGRMYPLSLIGGPIGVVVEDGFLVPKLGFAVCEVTDK